MPKWLPRSARQGRAVIRECAAEGRAWRALGVRYGVGDLIADLLRGRPYLDGQGRPAQFPVGG